MKRLLTTPRYGFKDKVADLGLVWHSLDTEYWHESAYYVFNNNQIRELEIATEECHQMFIRATDYVIENNLLHEFDIPAQFIPMIVEAWNEEWPALNIGRFDFGYDGVNPPKLFEYNADTPTSLLEASVIQWQWKEELFKYDDQFNSIHEKLVDAYGRLPFRDLMFASVLDNLGEDAMTLAYHMDCAAEAGLNVGRIHMDDIGCDATGQFYDLDNHPIHAMFKLYPWEWMVREEFGKNLLRTETAILEPIWKMIWSNKAILPYVYMLHPHSPYLLETTFEPMDGSYVKKPILAREGSNVTVVKNNTVIASTEGEYGDGEYIYQELYELPNFDGHYPVIGSWCIDGYAAGMGIRDGGLITDNVTKFTPHVIR